MAHLTQHFTLLDYSIFAAYLLLTVAIGTLFIKGQRNLDEYFLAGRSMGSVIVAMTILASLFSGISFLAAPSEGFANGPIYFLVNLGFFVATPLTTMVFLPFYYNARFFTAYQCLEERFSVQLRTLASASFIARVLLWLAAATYAPALALEQATGMPLWFTILCTGVLTTIYTTFGGMRAVIWTDVMQLVVLVGGQLALILVAVAGINSLTSAGLIDFYQRLWHRPDLSEKKQLRIARGLTFAYGSLVIVLAFLVHRLGTPLEATNKVIGLIGGPLIGLFLLGILTRRTTARGALAGWIGGLAVTLWVCFGTRISFMWYAMTGCATTMVIGLAVGLFDRAPQAKNLQGLVWSDRPPSA